MAIVGMLYERKLDDRLAAYPLQLDTSKVNIN